MKLMIVRHADPDYEHDSLTEKGWREAEYLSEYLADVLGDKCKGNDSQDAQNSHESQDSVHFYMSPYGRAQDTASLTLKKLGRTAEVMPWLKEFDVFIDRPDDKTRKRIPWDWLPQDWTQEPRFFNSDQWSENELMQEGKVGDYYREVTGQLDTLLARHGYVREGRCYRAEKPNHDTIVFFCHFGCEGVLLSHLWNVSPMTVWHGTCAQPSSVTTLVTEERREGIAYFRMLSFGEITHLYMKEEPPAFAARFCECYTDETRHD